jgi:hypothetical protein
MVGHLHVQSFDRDTAKPARIHHKLQDASAQHRPEQLRCAQGGTPAAVLWRGVQDDGVAIGRGQEAHPIYVLNCEVHHPSSAERSTLFCATLNNAI